MPNGPSRAIWKRVPCWAKTKVSLYGRGGKSALGGIISGSARGGSGRDIRSWPIGSSLDECMGNLSEGGVPISMWRRCRRTQGRTKATGDCP